MVNVLRIHPDDNVGVALSDMAQGAKLEATDGLGDGELMALEPIPFGHKVAIARILKGQVVIKYGASIGLAREDILPGQHVHVHNLRSVRGTVNA